MRDTQIKSVTGVRTGKSKQTQKMKLLFDLELALEVLVCTLSANSNV